MPSRGAEPQADGPRRPSRRTLAIIGGALVIVVAAAGGGLLVGGVLTATPAPPSSVSLSPSASASPTPSPTPSPTAQPTPSPTPLPSALADGRLTVLVLGSDSDVARRARGKGWLTDAITVVSVNAKGRKVALISLPRDTVDVPLPDGTIWSGKINSLALLRSPADMRDAMAALLGIPIDHYVIVDMDDFRGIVDAVGGVTVRVPYAVGDHRCYFGPGKQHLSGEQALCYARLRASDSDYARAGRHQQLLLAIRDQLAAGGLNLRELIRPLGSLQTDIPGDALPAYAELLRESARARAHTLVLSPPTYTTFVGIAGTRGWISIPNIPAIQSAVDRMLGE